MKEKKNKAEDQLSRGKDAVNILRRIDAVLDTAEFYHGSECRRVEGTEYYHCECGLRQLEKIQLQEIEPLLQRDSEAQSE